MTLELQHISKSYDGLPIKEPESFLSAGPMLLSHESIRFR